MVPNMFKSKTFHNFTLYAPKNDLHIATHLLLGLPSVYFTRHSSSEDSKLRAFLCVTQVNKCGLNLNMYFVGKSRERRDSVSGEDAYSLMMHETQTSGMFVGLQISHFQLPPCALSQLPVLEHVISERFTYPSPQYNNSTHTAVMHLNSP